MEPSQFCDIKKHYESWLPNQFPQKFVSRRNCGSGFVTRSYCFEISTNRFYGYGCIITLCEMKKHYETGFPPEADQPRAGKPVPAGRRWSGGEIGGLYVIRYTFCVTRLALQGVSWLRVTRFYRLKPELQKEIIFVRFQTPQPPLSGGTI